LSRLRCVGLLRPPVTTGHHALQAFRSRIFERDESRAAKTKPLRHQPTKREQSMPTSYVDLLYGRTTSRQ